MIRSARSARHARVVTVAALTLLLAPEAAADILPAGRKPVQYSYEIEGVGRAPDWVVVAWPRTCGSDGDPLGEVNLDLNPQWVSRMHDVDYEVLAEGRVLDVLKYCGHTMRLYGLPRGAFPPSSRTATRDDWTLGLKEGDATQILPALDAIDLKERIKFFAEDRRLARSDFRFSIVITVPDASPLAAVHDILRVEGVTDGALRVAPRVARYTYKDGAREEIAYRDRARPLPSRPKALEDPDAKPSSAFGDLSGAREPEPSPSASATPEGSELPPAPIAARPPRGWLLPVATAIALAAAAFVLLRRKKR